MTALMTNDELQRMATLLQVELTPTVRDTLQAVYFRGYTAGSKEMSRHWMEIIDNMRKTA